MPLYTAPPPAPMVAPAPCPPLLIVEWADKKITDRNDSEFLGEPRGAEDSGVHATPAFREMPFEYQGWYGEDAPDAGEVNRLYGLDYPHGEILVEPSEREAGEFGAWPTSHGIVVGVRRVWTQNEKWTPGSEQGMFPTARWREMDRATLWRWKVPQRIRHFSTYQSERPRHELRKQVVLFSPLASDAAVEPKDPTTFEERATHEQRVGARQADPLLIGFDAERGWEWEQPLPLREVLRRDRLEAKSPPPSGGCMGGLPWQVHVARAANGASAVAYNLWSKHGTLIFLCAAKGKGLRAILLPRLDVTGICAAGKGGWLIEGLVQTRDSVKSEALRIGADGSLQARGGYPQQ